MNIFESLVHDLQKPSMPPHAGEAFYLWVYYLAICESRALMLVCANHTTDPDLLQTIEHVVADVLEPQMAKLKPMLLEASIELPAISPDPPKANAAQIPPGARLVDLQIARMLVVKTEGMLSIAAMALAISQRTDIGALFAGFQSQVLIQGYNLRELMIKRGWFPNLPLYRGT